MAAVDFDDPGLVGIGDRVAAGGVRAKPSGLRHLLDQVDRLVGGGALLQDVVPHLVVPPGVWVGVGLLDLGGDVGGDAVADTELFLVDAAVAAHQQRQIGLRQVTSELDSKRTTCVTADTDIARTDVG